MMFRIVMCFFMRRDEWTWSKYLTLLHVAPSLHYSKCSSLVPQLCHDSLNYIVFNLWTVALHDITDSWMYIVHDLAFDWYNRLLELLSPFPDNHSKNHEVKNVFFPKRSRRNQHQLGLSFFFWLKLLRITSQQQQSPFLTTDFLPAVLICRTLCVPRSTRALRNVCKGKQGQRDGLLVGFLQHLFAELLLQ